jgi:hypothetical protein
MSSVTLRPLESALIRQLASGSHSASSVLNAFCTADPY